MRRSTISLAFAMMFGSFCAAAFASAAGSTATADEPTGALTLPRALAAALVANTELSAFSWQLRASEAHLLQAGLRPNPEASLVVEDILGTGRFRGGREAQVTLQLSQLVELGAKREKRVAVAAASREVAAREYEAKRAEVLADVTRKFIRVVARQQILELTGATTKLSETTLETVVRRMKAGVGSPLEEKKAQIALARSRLATEDAEHELAVAKRDLASTWASREARFDAVEGDLLARRTVPPYDQLVVRLVVAPDMLRKVSEKAVRQAEIQLAEARRIPNASVIGGVRRLEGPGEESFLFGLSVPLPLSDRNQGGAAQAQALLGKAQADEQATDVRLRTLLFSLHQELRHSGHVLDALEKEVLPEAEKSVALSRDGFTQGRFSLLELLDAERTLGEVRREHLEAGASYQQFVLEIEQLIGGPIEEAHTP